MHDWRTPTWCCILVAALCGAPVRVATAASVSALTGYSVTSWTEGETGPLGAVSAIAQDGEGYLWIGTTAGLFRFDGTRFRPWEAFDDVRLPAAPVTTLRIARDGALWVAFANRAGVARIHRAQVELFDAGPLRTIMAIVEDRQGTIWAASDPSLYRLADGQWRRVPVRDGPVDVRVVNAGVMADGHLWAGATTGLFISRDGGTSFAKAAHGWVWSVSEDRSGTLWLTDILRGFRQAGEVTNPRADLEGNGYRVLHDRQGHLWVATIGEGLWRVSDTGTAPVRIDKAMLHSGVFSDSVQSFLEDRDGNLWVGTTVGLYRLTRQKMTPLTNIGLVVSADVTADALWAGTSYGVVRFTRTASGWTGRRIAGPTVYVYAVHRDRAGALWAGASEGLFQVSERGLRRVPMAADVGMPSIACISSDSKGLWLANGSGVVHWDGRRFIPLQMPSGAPAGRPVCVHGDARDRAWIGFPDAKLLLREANGTFRHFGAETFGTEANTIYNVSETQDGAIWVATNVGVTRFLGSDAVTYTRANGLPADRVWTVSGDARGHVWLSLDLGLIRLAPDEFDRAAADPSYRVRFEAFDTSDGLAGAPILRVRAGHAAGGTVWFVRGGALTVAGTGDIEGEPKPTHGPARIEAVAADDRILHAERGAALAAGTKRLELDYTAIALTQPGRVRFRYRLEGFDATWILAGPRRTAVYTNLPPRSYRFVVQAGTDQQGWDAGVAEWRFSIQPAFFETAWFQTLVLMVAAAVVWGAWRFRVGLVRREYAAVLSERARLSREIHDTLLQGVVGVALQLDALAHRAGAAPGDMRDALVRTRRQVEAYIREARQSILDLRSPLLEARSLPDALRALGNEATADTAVRFTLSVEGRVRRCAPRLENELLRIAQEAITNAVRHAQAGTIRLELRYGPDAVVLAVVDDGRGITAARHDHPGESHYGLIVMKERAENLGGTVSIVPLPQGGTRIEAVLPAPSAA